MPLHGIEILWCGTQGDICGEHLPNGAHSRLNRLSPFWGFAGRNRITVGLGLSSHLFFLFSIYQAVTACLPEGTGFLAQTFMTLHHNNIAVGKYLVSPLAKPLGTGGYAASVSIRSGRGSATHDRVLRFSGLFDTAASALQYATEHALGWIKERSTPVCV